MKVNQKIHNEEMPSRNLGLVFLLDTNRINAKQKRGSVNQLERWHEQGVISLQMSETAYDEASAGKGSDNDSRRKKADDYTFISANYRLGFEKEWRMLIEQIVFPNGAKEENEKNDISILLDAKMGCAPLVTSDHCHILPRKNELLSKVGIRVITVKQAVSEIRKRIGYRDNDARMVTTAAGCRLPEWVGKD